MQLFIENCCLSSKAMFNFVVLTIIYSNIRYSIVFLYSEIKLNYEKTYS